MAYGEAKVYYDGSHYIAIPHTERQKKPKRLKREKEIVINENKQVIPEYEEVTSTLTLKDGRVLEEVEFVDGELKPVVNKVKQKGERITKKGVFERLYAENVDIKKKDKRKNIISTTVLFVVLTLLIMLISCNFRYGMLVIGSESMTGEINKGDAVIFEAYEKQKIHEGNVIIFEDGDRRVVHRVVDVKLVNGNYHYYTKGDANEEIDKGYVTPGKVVGIVHFKIRYIGWPTIWLRDIFS